jgi:hypothetical protein
VFTQHGFQASSLSASLPALEASEPVIAAVVGITLLQEHLNVHSTFDNVAIGVSIVALLTSVIVLASIAGHAANTTNSAGESPGACDHAAAIPPSTTSRHDGYRPRHHQPSHRRRSRTNS